MKKSTTKMLPRHKLVLHREAIALLAVDQLTKAAGGSIVLPTGFPCTPPTTTQEGGG
jgi:hypothetical protein